MENEEKITETIPIRISDLVNAFKSQIYLNKKTTEKILELTNRITKLEAILGVYTDVPKS